jgi:drug/metabolite transporter (DMT)-like permease
MADHGPTAPERAGGRGGIRWGARLDHRWNGARFGIVMLLLLVTFSFMASGVSGTWVPLVTVVLQGATLLAALAASEARVRLVRLAAVVIALGLASGVFALLQSNDTTRGLSAILSLLLVAGAPVVIASFLIRRRTIDVHTVLGAICIYVLLGMLFAFTYAAIGALGTHPFFAQHVPLSLENFLYFSFVTLTTVGYGDLTAAVGLGRSTAVIEALLGQLYLVTVVALVVSQLAGHRADERSE